MKLYITFLQTEHKPIKLINITVSHTENSHPKEAKSNPQIPYHRQCTKTITTRSIKPQIHEAAPTDRIRELS